MNGESERWAEIPGFKGRYEVSSFGRVRSFCSESPKILKTILRKSGYRQVNLYRGSPARIFPAPVHRLVAQAFVGPRKRGYEVHHLDANPGNNHFKNLRWITKQEHGGLSRCRLGEKHHNSKLTAEQVRSIKLRRAEGRSYAKIAQEFGVCTMTIFKIASGRGWNEVTGLPRNGSESRWDSSGEDIGENTLASIGESYQENFP